MSPTQAWLLLPLICMVSTLLASPVYIHTHILALSTLSTIMVSYMPTVLASPVYIHNTHSTVYTIFHYGEGRAKRKVTFPGGQRQVIFHWNKKKQGLRRICKLAKASNMKNWSLQLVRPAGPSSWSIQLVHPAGPSSWSIQLVRPAGPTSRQIYILHLTHSI